MTQIDAPMPEVTKRKVYAHLQEQKTSDVDRERLTGVEWLRALLGRGRYGTCGDHYHGECVDCGSTKCFGMDGYDQFDTVQNRCDCNHGRTTDHVIVPFDNFGQHVGFP